MKFECKDLDRALAVPELMAEAREHARDCPVCRHDLWLWTEMSSKASALREEWESPDLWQRISAGLGAEPGLPQNRVDWRIFAAIAALLIATAISVTWFQAAPAGSSDLLTEKTLAEVQQAEAAYLQSSGKLSRIADQRVGKSDSALTAAYREKLLLLDQEIAELRAGLGHNQFNSRLQWELASLYRHKKETLQEIVRNEEKN